ncbi:(2Fe-2S)-binding protein [Heliobacterium undosum]|uniref:(2Fe-2S)-binding protein n=2 Tax=Heliomicrobium undosum TaxID=121734 RepID=A0A845L0C7_9FIRM|nr:(2Fe-2S)-binding protein [Heliomicrobium undosum]
MDASKLVCGCKKVTYGDLQNAIAKGAKSFEEVQSATKVSTGCRKCTDHVKSLVSELLPK